MGNVFVDGSNISEVKVVSEPIRVFDSVTSKYYMLPESLLLSVLKEHVFGVENNRLVDFD